MHNLGDYIVGLLAALFIGLSKAGFGGGLGLLSTPLCVLAFGPRDAIGILLPLLCAGDAFSLWHYWRKWEAKNLYYLLPGVVVGVVIGVQLIGRFSARQLNIAIGLLAMFFVLFQIGKELIFRVEGTFKPNPWIGLPFGLGAGITSTFAHGAGPLVSMFLIPQKLSKVVYVGTTVLIFTWINWIKVPFYCLDRNVVDWAWVPHQSIINRATLLSSLYFLPAVPLGVWLGVWLNRKFSEDAFVKIIYLLTFLTGAQLVFNFDIARWIPR